MLYVWGLEKADSSRFPIRRLQQLQQAPVTPSPGQENLLGRAHRGPYSICLSGELRPSVGTGTAPARYMSCSPGSNPSQVPSPKSLSPLPSPPPLHRQLHGASRSRRSQVFFRPLHHHGTTPALVPVFAACPQSADPRVVHRLDRRGLPQSRVSSAARLAGQITDCGFPSRGRGCRQASSAERVLKLSRPQPGLFSTPCSHGLDLPRLRPPPGCRGCPHRELS